MTKEWITKKDSNGKIKHIPIDGKDGEKRQITANKLEWYPDMEYAYTYLGEEHYVIVYRAAVKAKNKYYLITVYPLKLINKNADGWDYRIATTENDQIIDEYDAGAEHYEHFKNKDEAKMASMTTLRDMLD